MNDRQDVPSKAPATRWSEDVRSAVEIASIDEQWSTKRICEFQDFLQILFSNVARNTGRFDQPKLDNHVLEKDSAEEAERKRGEQRDTRKKGLKGIRITPGNTTTQRLEFLLARDGDLRGLDISERKNRLYPEHSKNTEDDE